MEDLKAIARAVDLEPDAPVEKVLDAISELKQKASETGKWQAEALENLSKMERTEKVMRENVHLRAENFIGKAVAEFKIEKSEADVLTELFESGPSGEEAVRKLIATRKTNDYFVRKQSLNAKQPPSDPLTEIDEKAATLRKADTKLSLSDARAKVMAENPDLAERYRIAHVKGAGGAD